MRNLTLMLALVATGILSNAAIASDIKQPVKAPIYPVHLLPDESVNDAGVLQTLSNTEPSLVSNYVNEAIKVGKKNMDWLKHMNTLRPDGNKIALTKPGELTAVPIDHPKIYSPATIEKEFKEISEAIPSEMKDVVFGKADFTDNPPVDTETYIQWAKKVDKLYQTAIRWTLMAPNLMWYSFNKKNDIRGYYYLAKEADLSSKLQNFQNLSKEDKSRLTPLLVNLCENTEGVEMGCDSRLNTAIGQNNVQAFYERYVSHSKEMFDSVFQIQNTRSEITTNMSISPQVTSVPIQLTGNDAVNHFLSYNIEDEWKWNNWQLRLNFTSDADVHVSFEPGQTPHVNGIAGDTITMDDNAPLTEWDVQWTIRHEFGHVLGFPDCYVEFYDDGLKAMVNYQIDTANLMCSRAGKMQEIHYTEMKKNYFN